MSDKKHKSMEEQRREDENRDPITDAKGAHPLGAGVGAAAGGAATGAAVGSFAGPIGTAVGVVVGGLVGGYIGKGVAEKIDPTEEHAYWRENYSDRDYVDVDGDEDEAYDKQYGPAYQYGWESLSREHEKSKGKPRKFDEVESELGESWKQHRNDNDLKWDDAKPATKDAYDRVYLVAVDDDSQTK